MMTERRNARPLIVAGTVLGVGLGGFIDGILLHQILQWHHMVTSGGYPPTSVGNLEVNTLWDGLFHAFTWVVTVAGVALLWRASRRGDVPRSSEILFGSLLMGWGLFNLVEGTVNHQILGIHHVREGVENQIAWDLGFLAFGVLLIAAGWAIVRTARQRAIIAAKPEERRAA